MKHLLTSLLLASLGTAALSQGTSHGTVNVLVIHDDFGVIATDSRATDQNGGTRDFAQKLFVVDDRTVVSFANFLSNAGPFSPSLSLLALTTQGMLEEIIPRISKSEKPLSFDEKVNQLSLAIEFKLNALYAVYGAVSPGTRDPIASLEVIIAGYDTDGRLRSIKKIFHFPDGIGVGGLHKLQVDTVLPVQHGGFMTELSGPSPVVAELADRLDAFRVDLPGPLRSGKSSRATNATLKAAVKLAESLVDEAKDYGKFHNIDPWVIGGDTQEATLHDGKVELLHSLDNPFPFKSSGANGVSYQSASVIDIYPAGAYVRGMIYVDYNCTAPDNSVGGGLVLDDAAVVSGRFNNCKIFYNGGNFAWNSSIAISGGGIILGPKLTLESPQIALLKRTFPKQPLVLWEKYCAFYKLDQRVVANRVWGLED